MLEPSVYLCNPADAESIVTARAAVVNGQRPPDPLVKLHLTQDWWELYAAWPMQPAAEAREFAVLIEVVNPYEPFDCRHVVGATRIEHRPDYDKEVRGQIDVTEVRLQIEAEA